MAADEPNSVLSVMLSRMALWTLDSHTPSHFHVLGCFGDEGDVDEDEPVAGLAARAAERSVPAPALAGLVGALRLRCARQACQALGLPAAVSGRGSRMEGSVKEEWMWFRRARSVALRSVCAGSRFEAAARGSPGVDFGLDGAGCWPFSPCTLSISTCLTASVDTPLSFSCVIAVMPSCVPPRENQSGKPYLRLNAPGGSRCSSDALTVLEASTLALNVYVVKGTTRGWKTSVENVTSGGEEGYVSGKAIWKRRMASA